MSLDFIKKRYGSNEIAIARRQQKQLRYLTQSSVQEDATIEYYRNWAERSYATDDYFKNWIKTVLKQKNFISVFKFLRYPLPSAKLINDRIKPQLKRVFYADDAYSKYVIRGKEVSAPEELESNEFNEMVFNAILFNHNDIIVTDLSEANRPYRQIIPIENVVAIDSHRNKIKKICYTATVIIDSEEVSGYLVMDDERYAFYTSLDDDAIPRIDTAHDLGVCPADYISNESFDTYTDIVRKSIFSYVIPDLEEYTFLKTLQRMQDANGTFPVQAKMKAQEKTRDGRIAAALPNEPMAAASLPKSQNKNIGSDFPNNSDAMSQPGTTYEVPVIDKDGNINMDVVKNYIQNFYIPVDILEFIDKRIERVENTIISTVLGDFEETNQSAKNELQVGKSYDNKLDKLRSVSLNMSWVCTNSDWKFLAMKHGPKSVYVERFFGSDFFLESQQELYNMFANAPNPLERRNTLVRISQSRNKFNPDKAAREGLLYKLIPFASDKDFATALEQQLVSDENKVLQTQFDYYVSLFEAEYGDILLFYNTINATDSEKLVVIRKIITNLITPNIPKKTTEQPQT